MASELELERVKRETFERDHDRALKYNGLRDKGQDICPNCTRIIDRERPGHETGCVVGAMLSVIEDRGEIEGGLPNKREVSDLNVDALWETLGRLITDMERDLEGEDFA